MPATTDPKPIQPQALKNARERRNMTQGQLAKAIRCTKDTVSRWERGKASRVRSNLREGLCETLQVKWEDLTQPPKQDPASSEVSAGDVRIQKTIRKSANNALELVSRRYNVRPRDVLELAPLLFLIVAERSLLARQRRLDEMYKAIEESEGIIYQACGDLVNLPYVWDHDGLEGQLVDERTSISRKDIIGRFGGLWSRDSGFPYNGSPFCEFVRDLATGIPETAVSAINSPPGKMIDSYRVADDTLKELVGISGNGEQHENFLEYIREGRLNFVQCLRARNEKVEGDYWQWLRDECVRTEKEEDKIKQEQRNLTGNDEWSKMIGISNDNELHKDILRYINNGSLPFDKCLNAKQERDPDSYRQWLMDERARIKEIDDLLLYI